MASRAPPVGTSPQPRVVSLPQQKKILQDILDCIVELKTEFFENQQPITDDSIVLQRFCAKFEHLLQLGLKEKTSLLGRKKDYWDYFLDCLASAKGSNDGVKYIKSLIENKTSLGKGRAFIRFCLVHQRLADTIQQCVVNDKTGVWFMTGSVFCSQKEVSSLISALYDLNSLHFDLSPRGYDLDSAWPSFANRKTSGVTGAWNVPTSSSRRSSISSVDTLSQMSLPVMDSIDVTKLTSNLATAETAKSELEGQIGSLQKEKELANQSAWATQGELQAVQNQLTQLKSEYATLQEQHQDLNINFAQLRVDKDQAEKTWSAKVKDLKEKQQEEAKRFDGLMDEQHKGKKELEEENETKQREIDILRQNVEESVAQEKQSKSVEEENLKLLHSLAEGLQYSGDGSYFTILSHIKNHIKELKENILVTDAERKVLESQVGKESEEKSKGLVELKTQMAKIEQELKESQLSHASVQEKAFHLDILFQKEKELSENFQKEVTALEGTLREKEGKLQGLNDEKILLENSNLQLENEMLQLKQAAEELDIHLKDKDKDLKEINKTVSENLPLFAQNLSENKEELVKCQAVVKDKEAEVSKYKEIMRKMKNDCRDLEECLRVKERELSQSQTEAEYCQAELNKTLKEKEGKLKSVLLENKRKVADRDQLKSEIAKMKNENKSLAEQLVVVKASLVDVTEEHKSSGDTLTQLETELSQKKNELNVMKETKLVVDSENKNFSSMISNLSTTVESLSNELQRVKSDLGESLIEKESLKSELLVLKAESNIVKKNANSCEVVNPVKGSQDTPEDMSLNKERTEDDVTDSQLLDVEMACKKILGDAWVQENHHLKEKLGTSQNDFVSIIYSLLDHHGETLKIQSDEKSSHEKSMDDFHSQVDSLAKERDHLLGQMDAALEDAHHIKSKLTQTSEELAISYSQIENITSEKISLSERLTALMEEVSVLEMDKSTMSGQVNELKSACDNAEDEVQLKLSEKRNLEIQLEELESKYSGALQDVEEYKKQVEEFKTQTSFSSKVLEESLLESKNHVDVLKSDKLELEDELSALKQEKEQLTQRVGEAENEVIKLKQELQSQDKDGEGDTQLEQREKEWRAEKDKLEMTVESLNEEISSLEFQLSTEKLQHEDTSGSTHLLQKVLELEETIKDQEKEISDLKSTDGLDDDWRTTEIHKLQASLTRQEGLLKSTSKKLQETEEKLTEETANKGKLSVDLYQLRFSSNKNVADRDKQIAELKSENTQIKKQLVKMIRDKDNLWQKTEMLADEHKRKAREIWQDGTNVTHCNKCKAEFSLFLRKHHCRKCGLIFCWSCSDFWLPTTHSSKTSRVCNACFEQHNNMNSSPQLSTSLVNNDSDDEDKESLCSDSMSSNFSSREASEIRDFLTKAPSPDSENGAVPSNIKDESVSGNSNEAAELPVTSETVDASQSGNDEEDYNEEDDNVRNVEEDDDAQKYQIVRQEDILQSMTEYDSFAQAAAEVPSNMTSSIILSANELESGQVNRQNEVWIRPGKKFAIPIDIMEAKTTLAWNFTSDPKDIVFSVNYRMDKVTNLSDAEEVVAPCKCNAHKQKFHGELTTKMPGVYTLIFDNTYSRMTSKKIHYYLEYKKKLTHQAQEN